MRALFLYGALMCGAAAWAAEPTDLDALNLADRAPLAAAPTRDWRAVLEAGVGADRLRSLGTTEPRSRLAGSFELDKSLGEGWRFVLADRYDVQWQADASGQRHRGSVNTLRELYVSRQATEQIAFDAGRINDRQGVALGYNPTDHFRANSLRSVVTVDPTSIKSNRQGSVMLRGQFLWSGGAVSGLYSPKLATPPDQGAYSSLEASNPRDRWLVTLTQQLSAQFAPQWVLYGGAGESPQLGMNLTSLLNDANVAYAEWSGGRSRSQLSRALNGPPDERLRSRLSVGLTNTSWSKLSLTAEYEYNGAALDLDSWNALMHNPPAYGRYRGAVQGWQESPTREALFLYARWQDAGVKQLDLTAMTRIDLIDHSRLSLLEAVYHLDRSDLSLQFQDNAGRPGSDFGAIPQRRRLMVAFKQFF